jgi:predicted TPR repeat methyltransferase
MPQDVFQIAFEHHRAGRLRQAEALYRESVAADPAHADALHWLGVLLHQAGQRDEAIAMLQRAADLRPRDAAVQHNLGQACFAAGQSGDAIAALERAVELEPNRAESLVALAHTRLAQRHDGDADTAIHLFQRARAAGLDSADLHYDLGVALLAARRADEAIESFRAAVQKHRDHAWAYHHMALAHRLNGEVKEVRKCLIKALEIDPDLAAAWFALGMVDGEAGNHAQADASFRKAARAKQKADAARAPATVAELEKRITSDESAERLHHVLANATGLLTPSHVRAGDIATLFDKYAAGFDDHLINKLGYRVPQLIAEAVREATPILKSLDVLDLGCGTGLCGLLLRWKASKLHGVDLSPAMIEQARTRGVYDYLEVGDLVEALRRHERAFDLLTAADVLNYVGDLAPVMDAATKALRSGGLFVFTVEALGEGERFELNRRSHRYAHAERYVKHVASIHGFVMRSMEQVAIRMEAGRPVSGFLVVLEFPE